MPGTQKWIRSLDLPETTPWHPWTAPGTAAITGYATVYAPDFTFASIRDAGHMSPRYKPRELFDMIDAWLRKEPRDGRRGARRLMSLRAGSGGTKDWPGPMDGAAKTAA